MALTAGFKKFLGLVATVAVIGTGIVYYKHMPKKPVETPVEQVQVAQPEQEPVQEQPQQVDNDPPAQVDVQPAQRSDPSANRGLANVLSAGRR